MPVPRSSPPRQRPPPTPRPANAPPVSLSVYSTRAIGEVRAAPWWAFWRREITTLSFEVMAR